MGHLIASETPLYDIELISYKGQDPKKKMYRNGYEDYFNQMPIVNINDKLLRLKVLQSKLIMQQLGIKLAGEEWIKEEIPAGEFERTIIGMEKPLVLSSSGMPRQNKYIEGAEFVVAKWGDGFASPVHGHSVGYMHEEILQGKMLVNSYRMINAGSSIVRPVRTDIFTEGLIVSQYAPDSIDNQFKRQTLIHNFRSIGYTASLHYLPEHTRDGRDNGFTVQHFDIDYFVDSDLTQLTAQEGLNLKIGDVALVRSSNVSEYGDHYIVITGGPVLKKHGLRPEDIAIEAPTAKTVLDRFTPIQGLTLLKLEGLAKEHFLFFHDIKVEDDTVYLPKY